MMRNALFSLLLVFVLFSGCQRSEKEVKVAATTVPHAEILEQVKGDLKKEGITLTIVEVDDYILPNRLLAEEVVDANFFQHKPYLEAEKKSFGYDLIPIAKVHIEPLAIYSAKISSLDQLKEHATVAIPSDPSNETRSLLLLEELGFITLQNEGESQFYSLLDIKENPKKIKFREVDAALLTHFLPDVEMAVIPGNYALQGGLQLRSALAVESAESPYVNILVVRAGDRREELYKLAKALTSDKVRHYIEEKYKGQLLPAF